jgi:hypothetical protein
VQGRDLSQALGQDSYVLAAQQREEHGQKQRATCSSRQSQAGAMARARAYKAPRDLDRTPPHALDLAGAQTHRRLPVHGVSAAARSPCHRRPASRPLPSPVQPSEKTMHTSVKLPERGIEVCFDRVILCSILRFLVHTTSTSPREAHCAIGLN